MTYSIYSGAVNKYFAQGYTKQVPMLQSVDGTGNMAGTTWTFSAVDTVSNSGTIVGAIDLGGSNDTLANLA